MPVTEGFGKQSPMRVRGALLATQARLSWAIRVLLPRALQSLRSRPQPAADALRDPCVIMCWRKRPTVSSARARASMVGRKVRPRHCQESSLSADGLISYA